MARYKSLRLVIDYNERGREISVESVNSHSITYTVKDGNNIDYLDDISENQLDLFDE